MKSTKKISRKMHLIIILFLLLILTGVLYVVTAETTETQQHINKWNEINDKLKYSDLEDENPTFTNIETTAYYTPVLEDFNGNWCSPKKGSCFKSTQEIIEYYNKNTITECINQRNAGYCCIPPEDRGFYEEVKCQGSGYANGKIYHHADIKPDTQDEGFLNNNKQNGITAKGTDPTKQRTVAINPKSGTECFIPYWQKMYIYFGKDNTWNGVYMAEDTGSAFEGECKIDVYVGKGKNELDHNGRHVNGNPKIYLLDEEGEVIKPEQGKLQTGNVVGKIYSQYANTVQVEGITEIINPTSEAIQEILKKCEPKTTISEKEKCVLKYLNETKVITIKNNCGEGNMPIHTIKEAKKQNTTIGGYVTQIINKSDKKEIHITIKDETDTAKIILSMSQNNDKKINIGDYLISTNPVYEKGDIKTKYSDTIINGPDVTKSELRKILVQIAECGTAIQNACNCEIKTNQLKNITYKNNELQAQNGISILTDYIINQKSSFTINFEKEFIKKNGDIFEKTTNQANQNQICKPTEKYLLMCSYSDTNDAQSYTTNEVFRFTTQIK